MKYPLTVGALAGSASALGVNLIYESALLQELSKTESMTFREIDHELYQKATTSLDVYPNHKVGDLDFMGEVFYLFHMFREYEQDFCVERWRQIFYLYFNEEFEYDGFVETYGKHFLSQYQKELNGESEVQEHTNFNDKHLIGLLFILKTFESNKSKNKLEDALLYARTLTSYEHITDLSNMLYHLMLDLEKGTPKDVALDMSLKYAPPPYIKALENSIKKADTKKFLNTYSGIGSDLEQALPLIYHIMAHSVNVIDALEINATLGGASCARGIFIGALYSLINTNPPEFQNTLRYNIE